MNYTGHPVDILTWYFSTPQETRQWEMCCNPATVLILLPKSWIVWAKAIISLSKATYGVYFVGLSLLAEQIH